MWKAAALIVLSEEVLELQKSLFGAPGSVLIKTSLVKSHRQSTWTEVADLEVPMCGRVLFLEDEPMMYM